MLKTVLNNLKIYADQGNFFAQGGLGLAYNILDDYKKSFFWYKKSVEEGNFIAEGDLAYQYEHGEGTEVNKELAYDYYKNLAGKGVLIIIAKLGSCYKKGVGTKVDLKKATRCFADLVNYKQNFIYQKFLKLTENPINFEVARNAILKHVLDEIGEQKDKLTQAKFVNSYLRKKYSYKQGENFKINQEENEFSNWGISYEGRLFYKFILIVIRDIYIAINMDFVSVSINKAHNNNLSVDVSQEIASYWARGIKERREKISILPISKVEQYINTEKLFGIGR